MMLNLRYLLLAGTVLAFLPSAPMAKADTIRTGMLYVADYGTSELDRYQYTYDITLNTITGFTPYGFGGNTSNAYFLGGSSLPVKEGVQGTSDDLIVVVGAHGANNPTTLERFTLDGTYIGTIPVDFTNYGGNNVGIGNVAITPDGKYEYAPLETSGYVVKIDLSNGNIVDSYQFAGAHDVAIAPNGDVYAADYNASGAKVIRLDSNLNYIQDLVDSAPAGLTSFRPSGLSIASDGSLYVQDNLHGGPDSVLHYTFTNNSGILSANYDPTQSYIGSGTNNALEFTFGNNLGPDGNLYIAALGGGGSGSFSVTSNYVDGVYEFNPTTGGASLAIQGYTESPSKTAGPSGLVAPKYLQFDTNFVNSPDAGTLPEPGTTALLLTGFAGLALVKLRRRSS